jgi:hypothetical protein
MDLCGSGLSPEAGSCEHYNVSWDSVKGKEFLYSPS